MTRSVKELPYLARLLERGMSLKQAREEMVEGLRRNPNMRRYYELMMCYEEGRNRLRSATLAYREIGIEPPFAAVVDVNSLFSDPA